MDNDISEFVGRMQQFIEEQNIRFVDVKYTDLFGRLYHVTLPVSRFGERLFSQGVGFDSSNIPGFLDVASGDMILVPDPETFFVDPFFDPPAVSCFATVMNARTHKAFAGYPREILSRAVEYLKKSGIADRALFLPEFEFYLFNDAVFRTTKRSSAYFFDSIEASWSDAEERNHGYAILDGKGYHIAPPADVHFKFRSKLVELIESADIPVRYHHHEVGEAAQEEIEILPLDALSAADTVILVKYFARMLAKDYGIFACFMPKPLYGAAGSGMHYHQILLKGDKPVFYDDSTGYPNLSRIATNYICGLLTHGRALAALTNPTTNSFKRLVEGYEAPTRLFFGFANRCAAVRIPRYANLPNEKRFEYRPPDATANPYLAIAGMIMAGIDGIERDILPTEENMFGPINGSVDALPEEKRAKIASLPRNLLEAADALVSDHSFLTAGEVFSEAVIEKIVEKEKKEHKELLLYPHPREMELYFDI